MRSGIVLTSLTALGWAWGVSVSPGQELAVPISAVSPRVVVSLTDERDPDDAIWTPTNSMSPGGRSLPVNSSPHYEIFTLDTGSPATILSHDSFLGFDVGGAGRRGSLPTPIGGVGGQVLATNSDPLGVYAAGFGAVTSMSPWAVDRDQLVGQFNDSVLYAEAGDTLPNLLGTPIVSEYTTTIDYGSPHIMSMEGDSHRSPSVQLYELGSLAAPSRRIGMRLVSSLLGATTFFPSLQNFDDFGDDPQIPTIAGWFFLDANITNGGARRENMEMIFDTGSQGTFVSEQVAATLGFDVENDAPDFVVRVAGVTGLAEEVPGFIAEEFTLPGTGGGLTLQNVPLIVFNITDPRDTVNILPGLIGMNLFVDRNLVLNPEPGNAYLGVSDPMLEMRRWSALAESAPWSSPDSWNLPGTPGDTWNAAVASVTGTPQRAVVSEDSMVSALTISGENAAMTVEIQPGATLEVFGTVIVRPGGDLHVAGGTVSPLAVENRGGTLSGQGEIGGEVLNQGRLEPGGVGQAGVLSFLASFDQLAQGTIAIDIHGTDNSNPAQPEYDQVVIGGESLLTGTLEIATGGSYVPPSTRGASDDFAVVTATSIFGSLDQVLYDGVPLVADFRFEGTESFRDHVEDGLFRWIFYTGSELVLSNYLALPGDADGDGEVAFADFVSLSDAFGAAGDWTNGDFDGDGIVRFPDFVLLADHFGESAAAAAAAMAVPEPVGAVLGILGLLACPFVRRRAREPAR